MQRWLTWAGVLLMVLALTILVLGKSSVIAMLTGLVLLGMGAYSVFKARSASLDALSDSSTNARFMAEFGPMRKQMLSKPDDQV